MRRGSFAAGALFDFDGRRYRLVAKLPGGDWQAVDVESGVLTNWPWDDISAAYEDGHLILVPIRGQGDTSRRYSIADVSQEKREKAQARLAFLEAVEPRRTRSLTRSALAAVLDEVANELGSKPVSIATYYRWKSAILGGGKMALVGGKTGPRTRRVRGAAISKQVMLETIVAAKQNRKVGVAPAASLQGMRLTVSKLITAENAKRLALGAPDPPLTVPSKSTFNRIWNELPAEDRAIAVVGKVEAAHLFRGGRGVSRPRACLDLTEYDETRVPMFLFDERLGVPLGRPWLTWYIDVYSTAPVGLYLGFENPSDLTISSALRHCCLPKAYVAREYPTIVNRYAPAGLPRHVVFDNGLAQWGGTIEQLAFDLDMGISYTRPRTPWFKARVEGMFEVLNRTLLREMPGFVLAKNMHEYDPTVHGCIGLRHFLYILHAWLVDVFMQEPQGAAMQTPAALWEEGTREYPPSFLPRSQDLDLLFGIKRTGRLDHRGVRFANLRYHSPELHALRRRHGDKLGVEVKVDPSNLAFVHVRLPGSDSGWVRAAATDLAYAQNLSLHRHQLNQRNAREQFGDDSAASLRKAQDRLHDLIAEALPAALSIRSSSLIARALGIGTQHIFNNLNHDGELVGLSGPFAGESLNPLNNPGETRAESSALSAAPEQRQQHDGRSRPRARRTFDGDHSLRGADT